MLLFVIGSTRQLLKSTVINTSKPPIGDNTKYEDYFIFKWSRVYRDNAQNKRKLLMSATGYSSARSSSFVMESEATPASSCEDLLGPRLCPQIMSFMNA